mgnify:CR=1 FL=1
MDLNQIKDIIKSSIKSVFEQDDIQNIVITDETEIFGSKSIIDSLQLVNLIIKIEAEVFEQIGEEIIVVDDDAIIAENSPFETIQSLSEFVYKKISNLN